MTNRHSRRSFLRKGTVGAVTGAALAGAFDGLATRWT